MRLLRVLAASAIAATTLALSPGAQLAHAVSDSDLEGLFANVGQLKSIAKSAAGSDFIESLKAGPAKFQDYQCTCRLFTRKKGAWNDFGAADISWKYKDLFRARIRSSDYRNGSIVVREPGGRLRGCGGGALSFMKMTLDAGSRTLRLPTGYSLAKSDFGSLYEAMRRYLTSGGSMLVSTSAVSVKPFAQPVIVVIAKPVAGEDSPFGEVVYIDAKLKTPIAWGTFMNGEPNAAVVFENIEPNKGLTEDLFSL